MDHTPVEQKQDVYFINGMLLHFSWQGSLGSRIVYMLHITLLTFVRSVVYFNQPLACRHTRISYHDNFTLPGTDSIYLTPTRFKLHLPDPDSSYFAPTRSRFKLLYTYQIQSMFQSPEVLAFFSQGIFQNR